MKHRLRAYQSMYTQYFAVERREFLFFWVIIRRFNDVEGALEFLEKIRKAEIA